MNNPRHERLKGKIIDFRLRPPTGPYRLFFTRRMVASVNRVFGHDLPKSYLASTEERTDADERSLSVLLDEMDASGVRLGVMNGRHVGRVQVEDSYMAEVSRKAAGRLQGLAGINLEQPMETILAKLDEAVHQHGMVGACIEPGLARNPMYADDERLSPIYEKISALKVPLLFMTGPLAGPDITYTDPAQFDRVARRHPTMPVVLGHGCYPFVNEAIALAYKSEVTGMHNVMLSPDVYVFAPGGNAYLEGINWLPKRFVFASAYSFMGVEEAVERTLASTIRDECLDDYMYRNSEALLQLSGGGRV